MTRESAAATVPAVITPWPAAVQQAADGDVDPAEANCPLGLTSRWWR
ncbi:hypothetical protein ACTG9Q_23365 [Actinokineospora sp. 24-640]